MLHLGEDSKQKLDVSITTSQRGLCSKTASKTASGFAKTFAWFLVAKMLKGFVLHSAPKCTKVPFYLSPETQNMRKSGAGSPNILPGCDPFSSWELGQKPVQLTIK